MKAKEIKIDDIFFKDNFDCSGFEDNVYTQFAKTMARSVDIDLAKTPLVDILTGYIRYKEAEIKIERLNNIINELEKWLEENIKLKPLLTTYFFECDGKQKSISGIELNELKKVLDKLKELKEDNK